MKEINIEDFKYFIANDLIVVGVYEEKEDRVEFVVLKSNKDSIPRGKMGCLNKEKLKDELEQGISVILKDPVEAENYQFPQDLSKELKNFIKENK